MALPRYNDLFNPVIAALRKLGGSASISELNAEVISHLSLLESEITQPHSGRGTETELEYRLAWTRTYLKNYGLISRSERGVWTLTPQGLNTRPVDSNEVVRFVRLQGKTQDNGSDKGERSGNTDEGSAVSIPAVSEVGDDTSDEVVTTWRDELLAILQQMEPSAFERLCQRMLREAGFTEVRVTGRSGDGGIDGVGVVRVAGLLSFPVLFQCKRYRGSVGPSFVRELRGAMTGRAQLGIFLTTGTFTTEAKKEATRDGALPIDLIDGEQLMDKLLELRLGVQVKQVEVVTVIAEFFDGL